MIAIWYDLTTIGSFQLTRLLASDSYFFTRFIEYKEDDSDLVLRLDDFRFFPINNIINNQQSFPQRSLAYLPRFSPTNNNKNFRTPLLILFFSLLHNFWFLLVWNLSHFFSRFGLLEAFFLRHSVFFALSVITIGIPKLLRKSEKLRSEF